MWPEQPETKEPIARYQEGGSLRLTAALAPPASVRLLVLPPGAAESIEHPISREGDMNVAVLSLSLPGLWRYRFESVGAPFGAYEGAFFVLERLVPPPEV